MSFNYEVKSCYFSHTMHKILKGTSKYILQCVYVLIIELSHKQAHKVTYSQGVTRLREGSGSLQHKVPHYHFSYNRIPQDSFILFSFL